MTRPILLFVVLAGLANGQPAFDAASVKPGGTEFVRGTSFSMKGGPGTSDPGRITYTQQRLRYILVKAWDLQFDQILGPAWVMDASGDDSYTITATMPPDTTKERFQLMLQNLLVQRFQMKLHHETRPFPGYELVVAPGGPKLKATTQDPNIAVPTIPSAPRLNADGTFKFPPGSQQGSISGKGTMRAQYQDRSIADLVKGLGNMVSQGLGANPGAPQPRVVDKTGLTGKYDFTLEFDCQGCGGISAAMRATMPSLAGGGEEPATDPGTGLPNIFNALEKQLGLKLVKVADVPVDVLVIDHVERVPLEN